MTDYDSNGLDETARQHFKQVKFDKANQRHPSNQPDPTGWREMVEEHMKDDYWPAGLGVNLLCELRPDRTSYSFDPMHMDDLREDYELTHHGFNWDIDEVERKYYKIRNLVAMAIDSGDLASIDPPGIARSREDEILFGPSLPRTGMQRMVRPRDLLIWAYKNLDEVPALLVDRYKVPKLDTLPPEQLVRVLRTKLTKFETKQKNLVAVLALILEDHERFVRGKSISLQQVLHEVGRIPKVLGFEHQEYVFTMRFFQNLINPIKKKLRQHRKK